MQHVFGDMPRELGSKKIMKLLILKTILKMIQMKNNTMLQFPTSTVLKVHSHPTMLKITTRKWRPRENSIQHSLLPTTGRTLWMKLAPIQLQWQTMLSTTTPLKIMMQTPNTKVMGLLATLTHIDLKRLATLSSSLNYHARRLSHNSREWK